MMSTFGEWRTEALGRIAQITMGQSPDSKYYSTEESGWLFLQGCAEFQSRYPSAELFCTQKRKLGEQGSILLSIRAPVGRINIADHDYIIGRGLAAIKGFEVHQGYLEQYLTFISPSLRNASQGSTFEAINLRELNSWPISHPSDQHEQAKIAEILSTVDWAIEQTETLIAKQQRIKAGLMQDLLSRGIDESGNLRSEQTHEFKDSQLGRIPVNWEVETLGRVIGPIVSGWSPTCEAMPALEGEWAILKTTAVVWAGYTPSENKRLPSELRGVPSIEVHADDILITRKGPVERVGVVVHVKETRPRLMIPDTVFRMRVLDGSEIIPAFLPYALGSTRVQSDWFQKKIGLADAQVNLNHSILRATIFPKPDPKEQQLIVEYAKKISAQTHGDLRRLSKLQSVKAGLMQDLLTGKKRVTALLKPEPKREKMYA
jgi:type I restriction enzyme S subunit